MQQSVLLVHVFGLPHAPNAKSNLDTISKSGVFRGEKGCAWATFAYLYPCIVFPMFLDLIYKAFNFEVI